MKRTTFLAVLLAAATGACWAQTFPAKPVRIVVGVPAGGSIDLVARHVGQKLGESLGQTFLIDNRPGAAGIIGTEHVAKSAPDGYTLAMSPTAFISSHPSTFAKLPYDPLRDLVPVIKVVIQPSVLVVPPSAPYRSVADLVDFAKANPGKLNYGSGGDGSPHHMSGVMFSGSTSTKMVHVPYKGGAPAMQDLLGGRVDLIFAPVPEALPHIKGGKLRALGIGTTKRSKLMPEVAPISDTLPGFEAATWVGLLAPAGTPKEIVARMHAEVEKVLRSPDVQEKLSASGAEPVASSPEQFGAYIAAEVAKWDRVVKQAKIPPVQ